MFSARLPLRLNLSAPAYDRILKVARTIADLEGSEQIASRHLAEATCYSAVIGAKLSPSTPSGQSDENNKSRDSS